MNYRGKQTWNKEDLFAFICGEEVIVTTSMLGLLMKIEGIEGYSEPPKSFDYNDAWESISGKKEKFSDSQAKRKLLNVQAKLLHHFIGNILWYKQGSLEYINQKDIWLLYCVWTGTKIAQIRMHQHKDMRVICSPLSDKSQNKFVQTTVKDSQVAQAIDNLADDVAVINTNIDLMRKSNLQYQQNTISILNLRAEKVFGRTFELDDLDDLNAPDIQHQQKETDTIPFEEEKQHKEKGTRGDSDQERDPNAVKADDKTDEVPKSLAKINQTNVSKASGGTNPEIADMSLAETEKVLTGLEPLATVPASPKDREKAKASSSAVPSKPASPIHKPKKKVTKKASTATVEDLTHATKSDVASEHTEHPQPALKKRPRTKHPNRPRSAPSCDHEGFSSVEEAVAHTQDHFEIIKYGANGNVIATFSIFRFIPHLALTGEEEIVLDSLEDCKEFLPSRSNDRSQQEKLYFMYLDTVENYNFEAILPSIEEIEENYDDLEKYLRDLEKYLRELVHRWVNHKIMINLLS
ncbi:hypothetical protein COLO4_08123 [Corchorus olitorius]|uniref:Uncharacterized protein n=1 Tax=Corchorus olitorius TaxID=93759 RepID=A0A1R3KHD2_9ROSI|nr:hypothetical protein COLO4_08123 [Corchorus olitorius]